MLKRRRKQGKAIIFPHVHAYRLYPEEAIRKKLKQVDVINLEYASREGRLKRMLLWNLLSKFGIDKISLHGFSPRHATYTYSLKKIIKGIRKPVEFEKGIKTTQRILLFFRVPLLRRYSDFEELKKRTEYDIEQIKKHVKKGKTVGVLRGAAHEHILAEFLRKEGIKYEVIPLGGIAFNPKGTPLLISPETEKVISRLKKKTFPIREFDPQIINEIVKRYPVLTNYPTALFQIAIGLKRAKKNISPSDLNIVEEFYIKDPVTGKVTKVKDLIHK